MALSIVLGTFAPAGAEESEPAPQSDTKELQAKENTTWGAGRLVKGKRAGGKVAFTFDDGPDLKTTPRILDALERYEVPATFFVVGTRFAKNNGSSRAGADLLVEIAQRGFTVGNHTRRHRRIHDKNYRASKAAIAANADDIKKLLGYRPHLFRPPYGVITRKIKRLLRRRGDTLVMWSIDPKDSRRTPDKVLRRRVVAQILRKNGGVLVLHDTKPWTARVLPGILQDLESANCARLKRGKEPVLPVSLHYFMRDQDGGPRPIPSEIVNNTQASLERLSKRCKNGN